MSFAWVRLGGSGGSVCCVCSYDSTRTGLIRSKNKCFSLWWKGFLFSWGSHGSYKCEAEEVGLKLGQRGHSRQALDAWSERSPTAHSRLHQLEQNLLTVTERACAGRGPGWEQDGWGLCWKEIHRKLLTLLIISVNGRTGASQHLSIVACIPKGFFSHAFCLSLKAIIRSLLSLSRGSHAHSCSVLFTCLYRKDVKTSQSPVSPISTSPHPHNVWSLRGDFEDCAYTVYLHRLPCSYLWTLDAFQVCLQPEIQKSPGCSCTMSATTRKITFKDAVKWKDHSLYIALVPCKLYVGLGSGSATKGTW